MPVAKVAFFDVDRKFIGATPYGESSSIPNIPTNAAYFIASTKTAALGAAKYVHAATEEAKAGAFSDVVAQQLTKINQLAEAVAALEVRVATLEQNGKLII